jgi:hypothetical protein
MRRFPKCKSRSFGSAEKRFAQDDKFVSGIGKRGKYKNENPVLIPVAMRRSGDGGDGGALDGEDGDVVLLAEVSGGGGDVGGGLHGQFAAAVEA